MLIYFLGLLFLATSTIADSPLYIDELEDIVYGPDRHILDVLDDDKYSKRSELKVKVDQILARQSPEVQDAYNHIVKMKERQRSAKNMYWQGEADAAGVGNLYEKIKLLQTDMTVTEHHAESRTRQLWFEMNIRHGSDSSEEFERIGSSGSSEEYRYISHRRPSKRPVSARGVRHLHIH